MTSTPSTRRPLDGAALWSITVHFNQHGRRHWLIYAQVARVMAASVVAVISTFFTYLMPMIYGYVSPNFWRKRSMVFLITFIVDSVVNDLCLMAVAFVESVWKSTSELGSDIREPPRHRADAVTGTTSRR